MNDTAGIMIGIGERDPSDAAEILNKAIDDILESPYDRVDTDLIDKYTDKIARLLCIHFEPVGKAVAAEKAREAINAYERIKKERRAESVKRIFASAFKAAVIAAALLLMLGCAVYAVNKDAFYVMLEKMGYSTYSDMPRGNHEADGSTVKKYLKEYKYDSVKEIGSEADIPLLCPEKLPEGYNVSCIYFTIFEDERRLTYDITPYGVVTVNASDRYKAPESELLNMEKLTIGGRDYYVSEINGYVQALTNAGDFQYMITAADREELLIIISGMREAVGDK